jgi:hypothetical protein
MSNDKCVVCGMDKDPNRFFFSFFCKDCGDSHDQNVSGTGSAIQWAATRAREAQAEEIVRLRSEIERLKNKERVCWKCGGKGVYSATGGRGEELKLTCTCKDKRRRVR